MTSHKLVETCLLNNSRSKSQYSFAKSKRF